MATYYELWDAETRNLVATFETIEQAQGYLRGMLDEFGEAAVEHLGLLVEDDDDDSVGKLLAEGSALTRFAQRERV